MTTAGPTPAGAASRTIDACLAATVAAGELAGASYMVLRGTELVASGCVGFADREAQAPMRTDHLFRVFSNTKLVTSCAALQLLERDRFGLDDAIGQYIPALGDLRVLRPGASSLDDTDAAREPVRIRHLFTHTAGFTYAYREPGTPLGQAYSDSGLADAQVDSAAMARILGRLPLVFHPGSAWNYSVATDALGRLVEVTSGLSLDKYFHRHVFTPLGMDDTFFFVPPDKAHRLATLYVESGQPGGPLLRRAEDVPPPRPFLDPVPRLSGGGGLVSSLQDFATLVGVLLRGGAPLLRPETMPLVTENQLPAGMWVGKPAIEGRGHSFVASVTARANAADPQSVEGEVQWGGVAGTHWFFSPRENLAAVLMTQRFMGYGLPFWQRFKQAVRQSLA